MEKKDDEKFEDCNENKEENINLENSKNIESEKKINLEEEKLEKEKEKKEEKEEKEDKEEKKEEKEEKEEEQENLNPSDEERENELSEEEKLAIESKIISERKNAGELYKKGDYIQALNIYSLLLKEAKRAKLKDQLIILNCNKGICFNKLNDKEKALNSFSEALKYNSNYSKALCNRMLIYNSKGDYIEALDDYNKLKTIDFDLWKNYAYMEYELQNNAEKKKKEMTNEMLGKLKDIGNSILGNFGISLDNFKMTPNGQGGYSIQYQNNK